MTAFDSLPEQDEAKRLLAAALADGPRTRTSSTGRPESASGGRRSRSRPSCSAATRGSSRRTHPDLYVLEPLGDQIRIDAVREMRRDLHMRPFEADRRVYLVLGAHLLNEEAADALLKDLEEPPAYAVIVARRRRGRAFARDDPLALPARAVPAALGAGRAGGGPGPRTRALGGRGDVDRAGRRRAARPGRAAARSGGGEAADRAARRSRAVYSDDRLRSRRRPRTGCSKARASVRQRRRSGRRPRSRASTCRRARPSSASGAQRVGRSAKSCWPPSRSSRPGTAISSRPRPGPSGRWSTPTARSSSEDGTLERLEAAERAAELVRETWRNFEEFQLSPRLAFEALFVQLRRAFAGAPVA